MHNIIEMHRIKQTTSCFENMQTYRTPQGHTVGDFCVLASQPSYDSALRSARDTMVPLKGVLSLSLSDSLRERCSKAEPAMLVKGLSAIQCLSKKLSMSTGPPSHFLADLCGPQNTANWFLRGQNVPAIKRQAA